MMNGGGGGGGGGDEKAGMSVKLLNKICLATSQIVLEMYPTFCMTVGNYYS